MRQPEMQASVTCTFAYGDTVFLESVGAGVINRDPEDLRGPFEIEAAFSLAKRRVGIKNLDAVVGEFVVEEVGSLHEFSARGAIDSFPMLDFATEALP